MLCGDPVVDRGLDGDRQMDFDEERDFADQGPLTDIDTEEDAPRRCRGGGARAAAELEQIEPPGISHKLASLS